ncbi:hypothetical protein BH23ACT6_BH23ACT6_22710 [soil metagenome]
MITEHGWPGRYSGGMSLAPRPTRPPRRNVALQETSAGGLAVDVVDGQARVPLIARRNRHGSVEWCLPKGHVEKGETLVQTAAREVAEETGIIGRVLITLGTIEYRFSTPQHRIHKIVYHYLLEATGGTLTIENDPDHEAIDAAWVALEAAPARLTFPNEARIAELAWQRLAGHA